MKKYIYNIAEKNKIKFLILITILMVTTMSFSAIAGAKYMGILITVMEDFFSDGRKVLAAFALLLAIIMGIRAIASQNTMAFMENLFSSLWILAVISVVTTIIIAVGGATIERKYLIENNEKKSEVKILFEEKKG